MAASSWKGKWKWVQIVTTDTNKSGACAGFASHGEMPLRTTAGFIIRTRRRGCRSQWGSVEAARQFPVLQNAAGFPVEEGGNCMEHWGWSIGRWLMFVRHSKMWGGAVCPTNISKCPWERGVAPWGTGFDSMGQSVWLWGRGSAPWGRDRCPRGRVLCPKVRRVCPIGEWVKDE